MMAIMSAFSSVLRLGPEVIWPGGLAGGPLKPSFGLSGDVHVTHLIRRTKLDCSRRGDSRVFSVAGRVISLLSAGSIVPFDSFAGLSRSGQASVVYRGLKPANLRVGVGAGTAQFWASGLWVCGHAGACSSAAQRAAAGYVRR
jgi:hypothetical protein